MVERVKADGILTVRPEAVEGLTRLGAPKSMLQNQIAGGFFRRNKRPLGAMPVS